MKNLLWKSKICFAILFFLVILMPFEKSLAKDLPKNHSKKIKENLSILSAKVVNATTIEILFSNQKKALIDFYGPNIFRVFQDNAGGQLRNPVGERPANILVDNPRKAVSTINLKDENDKISISTNKITLVFDKKTSTFKAINNQTKATVFETLKSFEFEKGKVSLTLKENTNEYFYGGGVQNGRFSHKGKAISIENQNSWTDGGVTSPNPFYWSTNGYAVMWYTFAKGKYDFGAKEKGTVKLDHESDYLDAFFMVNNGAVALLNDFYQLTGNPILLPKFGFYQGHLNAYNRDYWKEDEKGILFEDGKRYKESQKDNGGVKESLNGEKGNYQFSARAVIDRYRKHDMPFGWILPNDGYGAGYGQTETLDGNIQNLKSLGDYAHENGVEIGLWTQSDLHPKNGVSALLQRDLVKEVKISGVRVLKTDVAWVGSGYSFGLNGVADAANIMKTEGNNVRPFIISLDGWAGTQRYASIWSGDQTGGSWEYIRFHIPTYIGSGLSGQPNITSDMDGIFGGKNPVMNTRDFQWKTFTPMQLNMDGWGSSEKYPQAMGEPITSINRNYLKWKAELMPYAYSISKEAVNGLPIMRAMFLEDSNPYTLGKQTQYQFMYGPNILVAPIYQITKADDKGNDIRNGIYLPAGTWIDYFTGEKYEGNRILNTFDAPVWKLPVFVKNGAIIPITSANNNPSEIKKDLRSYELYPAGKTSFTEYDDDGISENYKLGKGVSTLIFSTVDAKNTALITVAKAQGNFDGFVKNKSTEFVVNVTAKPKKLIAKIGTSIVKLSPATNKEEFSITENVYFYDAKPNLNRFATKGSEFEKVPMIKTPQLRVKLAKTDVTANAVSLQIEGFIFNPADRNKVLAGTLNAPTNALVEDKNSTAYTLTPSWDKVNNADYYEILFNGLNYSTIKGESLLFEGLSPETNYNFKVRAVNKSGVSKWTDLTSRTKNDPFEFAIKNITAKTSVENQGGEKVNNLFDFDEGTMWHTKYGAKAVPFDLVVDLKTINQLDKFEYLPRTGKGNGVILKGTVSYSNDKETWTDAGAFTWERNDAVKTFKFSNHPTVRFIKISVTEAVGEYGSGRELYIFKVPGTESYLPGDINNDRLIDINDLTSYTNYTGLRQGDADFEGYVSNGDINKNGLIDAFDISVVATQIDAGVEERKMEKVAGKLEISTAKQNYSQGEEIEVLVKGINLTTVNALSFALPYNASDYEFVAVKPLHLKSMENFTNDRLHTNGSKSLYPTFVNVGKKETLSGSEDLFIIKLKAKRKLTFNLKLNEGLLVDKNLNFLKF